MITTETFGSMVKVHLATPKQAQEFQEWLAKQLQDFKPSEEKDSD